MFPPRQCPITISSRDCPKYLRAEAARTADAKPARRILAMALVLDEHPRVLAAPGGMDRQMLRDWMYFYNADGLAGLADLGVSRVWPKPN